MHRSCKCCGTTVEKHPNIDFARGLCSRCYATHKRNGSHIDFPRSTRPTGDTVEDYKLLRSEGFTTRQIAERIGIKPASVNKALQRARNKGLL